MLQASDSPLVSGNAPGGPAKAVHIRVLRSFLLRTEPQKVDAVLEVPRALAAELVGCNKAVICEAPKKAPSKPADAKKE